MNLLLYAIKLVDDRGGFVDLNPEYIGIFGDYDKVMEAACRHVVEQGRGCIFRVFDEDCDPLARIEILRDRCEFATEPFPDDDLLDELYESYRI